MNLYLQCIGWVPFLCSYCKMVFAQMSFIFVCVYDICLSLTSTVDSRYLEFDGTMEKIRVNRSSTQEEL